jgi:hypothetical protein
MKEIQYERSRKGGRERGREVGWDDRMKDVFGV